MLACYVSSYSYFSVPRVLEEEKNPDTATWEPVAIKTEEGTEANNRLMSSSSDFDHSNLQDQLFTTALKFISNHNSKLQETAYSALKEVIGSEIFLFIFAAHVTLKFFVIL